MLILAQMHAQMEHYGKMQQAHYTGMLKQQGQRQFRLEMDTMNLVVQMMQ